MKLIPQQSNILITGAAMGMGKIYSELAVRDRFKNIILLDIDLQKLEQLKTNLSNENNNIDLYKVDLSNTSEVIKVIRNIVEKYQTIHVIINNAGIVIGKKFEQHSYSDIEKSINVNTSAPMILAKEVLPSMILGNRTSRIINIASAAGLLSNPNMSVYCASKSALVAWSDSLRLELKQQKIHHVKVTTVCPSYISTGMFAGVKAPLLTPILTPENVTSAVWKAMYGGKSFVMMPWTVSIIGILKGILPRDFFDFIAEKVFGVYNSMDKFTGRK